MSTQDPASSSPSHVYLDASDAAARLENCGKELFQIECDGHIDDLTDVPGDLLARFDDVMNLSHSSSSSSVIVVIDDNMYYSSMRHEVFQLARKYHTGFAQLYFPVDVREAVQRNLQRDESLRVSTYVIETMAERLEVPSSEVNVWEERTMTMTTKRLTEGEGDLRDYFESVMDFLSSAIAHPVLPQADQSEAVQASRDVCLTNDVHRADTVLRKLIGRRISCLKDGGQQKAALSTAARQLNACRTDILSDIRSGSLTIPPSVSSSVNDPSVEIIPSLPSPSSDPSIKVIPSSPSCDHTVESVPSNHGAEETNALPDILSTASCQDLFEFLNKELSLKFAAVQSSVR